MCGSLLQQLQDTDTGCHEEERQLDSRTGGQLSSLRGGVREAGGVNREGAGSWQVLSSGSETGSAKAPGQEQAGERVEASVA